MDVWIDPLLAVPRCHFHSLSLDTAVKKHAKTFLKRIQHFMLTSVTYTFNKP